jgi:hypothetical protein
MQIILDISANTHQNDERYYRRMIDVISRRDLHKHEVIIKGQLFRKAGENIPQDIALLERMANWTFETYGYKTTASVFDKVSLALLLLMDIPYELPFIKIANNRDLDWLIGEIPRKIPVYMSISPELYWGGDIGDAAFRWQGAKVLHLLCVTKYPAEIDDYGIGPGGTTAYALSDHTIGLELLKKHEPKIYECHFVLEHGIGNLDGGEWAKTPMQLGEIFECI